MRYSADATPYLVRSIADVPLLVGEGAAVS